MATKTLASLPPSGTPAVLVWLATAAMTRILELIRDIPDGSEEERGVLATAAMAEILARTLVIPDASGVAEITNAVLSAHKLTWRLVSVS